MNEIVTKLYFFIQRTKKINFLGIPKFTRLVNNVFYRMHFAFFLYTFRSLLVKKETKNIAFRRPHRVFKLSKITINKIAFGVILLVVRLYTLIASYLN